LPNGLATLCHHSDSKDGAFTLSKDYFKKQEVLLKVLETSQKCFNDNLAKLLTMDKLALGSQKQLT